MQNGKKKIVPAKKVECHRVYDTDVFLQEVGLRLIQDFRKITDKPTGFKEYETVYRQGIPEVHNFVPPSYSNADYLNFKCWYQLQNLCKRYVSQDDYITPKQRKNLTVRKFLDVQTSVWNGSHLTYRAHLVLRKARAYVKEVLGSFDMNELCSYAAYGRRANNGVPYVDSYLHNKVGKINGSADHISWFNQTYLPQDDLLMDYCTGLGQKPPSNEIVTSLDLACVPKKHNIDRTVMPNTVLGTLYTSGLMVMIMQRLSRKGYHIPSLQTKHGLLAEYGSRTGKLATGDLSSASDLPGFVLANWLLPRKWLAALKKGRISFFRWKKKDYKLESFMAMGIGFTFPLETLFFLALLKSIQELTQCLGTVSVYGDDLIYPSKMAPYVAAIFKDLGLVFNHDKSFSTGFFRESCGHDFIYGKAVRPFQPELLGGRITVGEYRDLLFKFINGLSNRWDRTQITGTLYYLHQELNVLGGGVLVPPDSPDDAGIHYCLGEEIPWYFNYSGATWSRERQMYSFSYYKKRMERFYVSKHLQFAYYWERLRQTSLKEVFDEASWQFYMSYLDPADSCNLTWAPIKGQYVRTRARREPRLNAYVPCKRSKPTPVRQTGYTSAWTVAL